MKYSQLVHMSGDVKHWLEKQLKSYGIDGDSYEKYLNSLLEVNTLENSSKYTFGTLDYYEKCQIESIIEELLAKLKDIERNSSRFEISSGCDADTLAMDSSLGFSNIFNGGMNCIEPIKPCLPPISCSSWTRGLLHDSASEITKNKMDDYFSTLFYDNPTTGLGQEFTWNRSDHQNNQEIDHINFYNMQNLIVSEGTEQVYEGNTEVDNLIAKFNANVEEIWKGSSESDHLQNVKYQNLLQQNFLANPYIQYGPNVIWSFEQSGKTTEEGSNENAKFSNCKSSFSQWNKFVSPIFSNSYNNFDNVLSAFNATLSSLHKWSAVDGHNLSNTATKEKLNSFVDSSSKATDFNLKCPDGFQYHVPHVSQNNQEEDLLTSAKTHFRPIRTEELGSSQTGIYADGTTFAISNDLDKVAFKRSESGLLYIEADAETPRKYMEFKEKEGGLNKGDWDSDASSGEEFVPKFRVRQSNEKCIQTDDLDDDQIVPPVNDTDCESVSCKSDDDEFFFPGDNELAQNIINSIEEHEDIEVDSCEQKGKTNQDCYYISGKMDALEVSSYHKAESKQCVCGGEKDWNQNSIDGSNKEKEWSQIWKTHVSCESCQLNSEKLSTKDKFRFREELTQEGEQLLLDLSCLQQLYSNSDWCDDDSITVSDFNEDENQNSSEEVISDGFPPLEVAYPGKGAWWSTLIAKEEPMKNGFDLRCLWTEERLFPELSENDKNKMNEKTNRTVAEMRQAERKRRNSSSQKACNQYMEGQCRRPHCRFAHCDSAIPCPFFEDASCMKGESCPLSHGLRRPLSL
ncbi:hypothetical protein RUM44_001383 [Polyplax serrata]|uniref:C3H1-type domain-containing protein n=1 Tax=Polyplax serrata TaxID=468196 RepID=A0ABR1AJX7_POLSC